MTDLLQRAAALAAAIASVAAAAIPSSARADVARLDLAGGGAPVASRGVAGPPSLGAPIGGLDYGALLGLDIPPAGYGLGVRFTGEVMYGLLDLAPDLRLDLGGRLALHFGGLDTHDVPDLSTSAFALDLVPDLKIKYAAADAFAVYGDFGLGLAYLRNSASRGAVSDSSSTMAFAIQFGAGAAYALTSSLNVLGEVRFNVYTASGSGTFIAFPQIGLQLH